MGPVRQHKRELETLDKVLVDNLARHEKKYPGVWPPEHFHSAKSIVHYPSRKLVLPCDVHGDPYDVIISDPLIEMQRQYLTLIFKFVTGWPRREDHTCHNLASVAQSIMSEERERQVWSEVTTMVEGIHQQWFAERLNANKT